MRHAPRLAACVEILASSLIAALSACGGGSGGGASVATSDSIALAFPPAHSLTDNPRVQLLGTTARPRRVARIDANGIPGATGDGFAHWNVDAALGADTTQFEIEARDAAGGVLSTSATTVEFAPLPEAPVDLASDPAGNVVLFADLSTSSGLLGLDLATGRPIVVSGPNRGVGPDLGTFIEGVAVDATNDRAFVLANISAVIDAVDLRNGNRRSVSDFTSAGVKFGNPRDVALDDARSRLVVADFGLNAILAVDIATGTRSVLSDATHGTGAALDRPERVVVVAGVDIAIVITRGSDDLIGVNLANGDRTIVSGATHGKGPALAGMQSVTFDPNTAKALVANGDSTILQVDLATGNRLRVAADDIGTGPSLIGLGDLVVAPDQRVVAIASGQRTFLGIDLATGDRSDLETLRVGSGDRITHLIAISADAAADDYYILATDFHGFQFSAVDPRTGDRRLVSSPDRGLGPDLTNMDDVAVADRRGLAYVPDFGLRALVAIDLASGDRTIVSDAATGAGVAFSDPNAVAIDDAANLAFVADFSFNGFTLIGVDLVTGNRTEFSGPNRGSGPSPDLVRSVAIEQSGQSVLLLDELKEALVRVDLVTGNRAFASGQGVGAGPAFQGVFPSLAPSRDRKHALLSDRVLGLVDVDLATGDRAVVASNDLALGPAFSTISPFSAFGRDKLFAIHDSGAALVEIDLASGNRVVISR